jgi:hypothetical protein
MRIASLQVGYHSSARQYFVPPAGTNIPGKDSVFVEHLEERNMAQLDHLMLYQIAFYCHPPNDCVFRNTALSYSVTVASDPAVPCMTGDLPETSRLRLGAWPGMQISCVRPNSRKVSIDGSDRLQLRLQLSHCSRGFDAFPGSARR